jgi:hypothetical protein
MWQAWKKEFQPKLVRKEQLEAQTAAANRRNHDSIVARTRRIYPDAVR